MLSRIGIYPRSSGRSVPGIQSWLVLSLHQFSPYLSKILTLRQHWIVHHSYQVFFLGLHPQHTEVPRLGVKQELQLPVYTTAMQDPNRICDLHHSSQQCQIPDPLSEARDGTSILMDTSRIRFCCVTTGTPQVYF